MTRQKNPSRLMVKHEFFTDDVDDAGDAYGFLLVLLFVMIA